MSKFGVKVAVRVCVFVCVCINACLRFVRMGVMEVRVLNGREDGRRGGGGRGGRRGQIFQQAHDASSKLCT